MGKPISRSHIGVVVMLHRTGALAVSAALACLAVVDSATAQSAQIKISTQPSCAQHFMVPILNTATSSGDPTLTVYQRQNTPQRLCRFTATVVGATAAGLSITPVGRHTITSLIGGPGPYRFRFSFRRASSGIRTLSNPSFVLRAMIAAAPSTGTPLVSDLISAPPTGDPCNKSVAALQVEERLQRSCSSDTDCSTETIPWGCGCHHSKPIHRGGNLGTFNQLLSDATKIGCLVPEITSCDCMSIEGVVCRSGVCDWKVS